MSGIRSLIKLFFSDKLVGNSDIRFTGNHFLTSEFGNLKQDTAKYYSHNSYEPDDDGNLKQVSHYYGGTHMGFGALIMMSDQFIQLRKPFPHYVRTFDSLRKKKKQLKN